MAKWMHKICGLLLLLTLAALLYAPAAAAEDGRTVRVAYPIQPGLTDVDESGNHTGYTYEYLQEIAQYTGWEYEFIEMDGDMNVALADMMDRVKRGEIDLMGALYYSDSMKKDYEYSSHSYGISETVLQAPDGFGEGIVIRSQIQSYRIATPRQGARVIQELDSYCERNRIEPTYIYCDTTAEQVRAVREGRADMMLNTSVNYVEGMHIVAHFDAKPFYFVTGANQNHELMEELDRAILNIEQADPYFTTRLYEKYFVSAKEQLLLSEEEQKYIESAGVLRAGIVTDQPPYQYLSQGKPAGIAVDLLDYLKQQTGLSIQLIQADSEDQLYELAARGEIDLVAVIPYNYEMASRRHLAMSRPYVSSPYMLLMNETMSEESITGKRLALPSTHTYQGQFVGQVVEYGSLAQCIAAVSVGEADYTYADANTAQYYTNQPEYRNLKMVPQTYGPGNICFGVVKPVNTHLLSILNKAVTTISEIDQQAIITRNIIIRPSLTLGSLVRSYPLQTVLALASVFLIIVGILSYFLRQRARLNHQNELALKKYYRVCAMLNEYFFEYDFNSEKLVISIPSQAGIHQTERMEIDGRLPEEEDSGAFMAAITAQQDGVKEMQLRCRDGKMHWLRLSVETVYDQSRPVYALGKLHIIDQEREEREALRQKAELDSLTQVYNAETIRRLYRCALGGLKAGQKSGLIILDVDNFKAVNDSFGHLCGDRALEAVAAMLTENFRGEDLVGRPGGDEFLVYMGTVKDENALADKCAAICAAARAISLPDGPKLTLSIGAALAEKGDDPDELYQKMDKALYQAKANGRDSWQVAQPGNGENH